MYQYSYRLSSFELWQLSMYYVYGSMVGVCNVIFTAALLILTAVKWQTAGPVYRLALILGCCLFTVLQPLFIYMRARRQAAAIGGETTVRFDGYGLHVTADGRQENIPWARIGRISKKPTMIVVFADTTHGYVFTNRVLGEERERFYQFASARIRRR